MHLILLLFLLWAPAPAPLQATFQVEHNHLFSKCWGQLIFDDTKVEYRTDKKEHARVWKYEDIQQIELAEDRISVLTYHDRKIEFGADQSFDFKLLNGKVSDEFRRQLAAKLARPMVSSIIPAPGQARYTIPVRHRRFMNDSEGTLEVGDDSIVYRAGDPKDSGIWRYAELLSVGSTGPFQLRLGALKKTEGEYGEEKNYVFDLKRRLTEEEYDFIWTKIYRR